jgi:hypothetical protein
MPAGHLLDTRVDYAERRDLSRNVLAAARGGEHGVGSGGEQENNPPPVQAFASLLFVPLHSPFLSSRIPGWPSMRPTFLN